MKKFVFTFLLCFSVTLYAQNVTVSSGKTLTIERSGSITIGGNLTNSGSVTLNSDSNEFAVIKVSGTSSGNITYNRWVNQVGSGDWDLIGSPVSGQTISNFVSVNTAGDDDLATSGVQYAIGVYNNSTDTWDNYTSNGSGAGNISGAGSFDIGKGYAMASVDGGSTLAFTGTISVDNETQAIEDNDNDNSGAGRIWNLVANPYPSYLNVNTNADGSNNLLTINGTANLHNTYVAVYGWDADGSGYTIYN